MAPKWQNQKTEDTTDAKSRSKLLGKSKAHAANAQPQFMNTPIQIQMSQMSSCGALEGFLITGLPNRYFMAEFQRYIYMLQFNEQLKSWGDFNELTNSVYAQHTFIQSDNTMVMCK